MVDGVIELTQERGIAAAAVTQEQLHYALIDFLYYLNASIAAKAADARPA